MRLRSVAYLIVAAAIAAFVVANWSVVTRATVINFLLGEITAPLGLLVVVIGALVALAVLLAHGFARLAWAQERRGLTEEIKKQRQRADSADDSRLRELRDFVAQETQSIREQLDRMLASLQRK